VWKWDLNLFRFVFLAWLVLCFWRSPVFAGEALEYPGNQDDLNTRLVGLLVKLETKYYSDDKTRGFTYRYRNRWNDSFDFDFYITRVGKNSPDSLLRVESSRQGQERFWKQIAEQEILQRPPREHSVALERKSHFLTQSLNLVSPIASVAYNSYKSPLFSTRDTLLSTALYFALDLFLVGGAYYYAEQKLPEKNLVDNLANVRGPGNVWESPDAVTIFAAMAVSRGIRAFDAWEDTTSHNKAAHFGWKFQF